MIIDFRVRPPYKGYLTTFNFRKATPPADPTRESIFSIGKRPNVSAIEGSIALFMREMDATGTERAVIMGRKADTYGVVDNNEILELSQNHPGRFIPFAGVNPSS